MKSFALILFLFLINGANAQESDSLNQKKNDTIHSVKKAAVLSLIFPGAGQIYNHIAQPKGKKNGFWKVPLVWGTVGFMGYALINNQGLVNELRDEYRYRQETGLSSPQYSSYDDQGILSLESSIATSRDLTILGLAFSYILQVADAAVEAHFIDFDVSEDLSLNIQPYSFNSYYGFRMGLTFEKTGKNLKKKL